MAAYKEHLEPDRLCEAAEAAMKAAMEIAAVNGGRAPYPADLMGTASQPEVLCQFTKWEVEQGCEFLIRLGFLEKPKSRKQ